MCVCVDELQLQGGTVYKLSFEHGVGFCLVFLFLFQLVCACKYAPVFLGRAWKHLVQRICIQMHLCFCFFFGGGVGVGIRGVWKSRLSC